jgi:hypothetical protein
MELVPIIESDFKHTWLKFDPMAIWNQGKFFRVTKCHMAQGTNSIGKYFVQDKLLLQWKLLKDQTTLFYENDFNSSYI